VLLFIAALAVILLSVPVAAAAGPQAHYRPTSGGIVVGGQSVGYGLWGLPYAQSDQPTGPQPIDPGNLVYDSSVTLYLLTTIPGNYSVSVSVEQYHMATGPEVVRVVEPNGTVTERTEQLPYRASPIWSNATIYGVLGLQSYTLPLPQASTTELMSLQVGDAVWSLTHLTPTADSLAALTAGGLEAALAVESAITGAVLVVVLYAGRALARRAGAIPPTTLLWPAAFLLVPLLLYFLAFVPFSQAVGSMSPLIFPALVGVAVFPYGARLWSDEILVGVEGYRAESMERGEATVDIVPFRKRSARLEPAPESWREVLYTLMGAGPEPVQGHHVQKEGIDVSVDHRPIPVGSDRRGRYSAPFDGMLWRVGPSPVNRTRSHLERPVLESGKKAWLPRIVRGRLDAHLIEAREPVRYSVGLTTVEGLAEAQKEDQLLQVAWRGRIPSARREYAEQLVDLVLDVAYGSGAPRSNEEILARVKALDQERRDEAGTPPAGEEPSHAEVRTHGRDRK
jgi:hypothetical protein